MQEDTVIKTKSEMDEFALKFAKKIQLESKPIIVLISGEMGAGKTYFVKKVGEALGVQNVKSPSYTLIDEHLYNGGKFIHIDLYNIKDENELTLLNIKTILQNENILLIEWADMYMSYFDQLKDIKIIKLTIEVEDTIRIIKIEE